MISIENVKSRLKVLSSLSDEEIERYEAIITSCIFALEGRLAGDGKEGSERLELYAAAKANYHIALINDADGDVTSFSAGDLSISRNADALVSAEKILKSLEEDCSDLIKGDGFAFECV